MKGSIRTWKTVGSAVWPTNRHLRGRKVCDFGDNTGESNHSYCDEADMNS